MTDREYACASIVFACIAAHEAAAAIRACDLDDVDRVVALANAAQPDGLVRVARHIDRHGSLVEWNDLFRDAYLAVNDALIATNRSRMLEAVVNETGRLAVDARLAATTCAPHFGGTAP